MPPQPAAFEQMLTLMAGMEDDDEIDAMLTQVFQRANSSPCALSACLPSCGSRVAAKICRLEAACDANASARNGS